MTRGWLLLSCWWCASVFAETPLGQIKALESAARIENPQFSGFSAERGKALYSRRSTNNGASISCASCHGADPKKPGKTPAFRTIEPLAPIASPLRFTDARKTEKWFRRNCDDVFKRACTAQEKGDFISWLAAVR